MTKRLGTCSVLWLLMFVGLCMPAQAIDDSASGPAAPAAPKSAEAPKPAEDQKPKLAVHPYGRVEMDITTSSRGTNPLDPRQFNGYATAAGPEPRASSTFNPRFSVLNNFAFLED
jgi:hypothetical protein